jgi:hypothetical protein
MTVSAPLIITSEVVAALAILRELAAIRPVNVLDLMDRIKTRRGAAEHRAQMERQTYDIETGPYPFRVTFSMETGHPGGNARHLSISIRRDNRVPSPEAVIEIATIMGFEGELTDWAVYPEALRGGGAATNVVQPIR